MQSHLDTHVDGTVTGDMPLVQKKKGGSKDGVGNQESIKEYIYIHTHM